MEQTGAEQVSWDLQHLFETNDALIRSLSEGEEAARRFAGKYRTRVGMLEPEELAQALKDYQRLQDDLDRCYTFAYLDWCTATTDPTKGALFQQIRERYTAASQQLIFFELELIELDDQAAGKLLSAEELQAFRHFIKTLRLRKGHVLSEGEEKILSEKAVTGRASWTRYFDQLLGGIRFQLDGQEVNEQLVLSKLYDSHRETRQKAAMTFTQGLKDHLASLTFIFNTVLADKASDDRLRRYSHWLASRNISNEISDESVQILVDSVTEQFELVARFYRLKRKLLGYDKLWDYDRYAPVGSLARHYRWGEARDLVCESFGEFHSDMGEIAERFFEDRWIDAPPRPAKRSGAFSHRAVPQVHPYILVNFTGRIRDVQTLAHELGHGVHQTLSNRQGSLQASPPLTTSEMASVFGEMLVFERMISAEEDANVQLGMLVSKIDDTIATVFRQVAMNQFEDRIHTTRRQDGELAADDFSRHWIETQNEMFGGSVELGEHYRIWWSYIPHFIQSPGYVYAYAFGELLVLALYEVYKQEGPSFPGKYLELLEAGGSNWPQVLVKKLGVDLQDPDFWNQGLQGIKSLIVQAEQLSEVAASV